MATILKGKGGSFYFIPTSKLKDDLPQGFQLS